jgi:hypothetical protein
LTAPDWASAKVAQQAKQKDHQRTIIRSTLLLLHHLPFATLFAVLADLRDVGRHAEVGLLDRLVEVAEFAAVSA